jgi:hypothetical protein
LSSSSFFSRTASSDFMPPYYLPQRSSVDSLTSKLCSTTAIPAAFNIASDRSPCPQGIGNLHNDWISFSKAGHDDDGDVDDGDTDVVAANYGMTNADREDAMAMAR